MSTKFFEAEVGKCRSFQPSLTLRVVVGVLERTDREGVYKIEHYTFSAENVDVNEEGVIVRTH